MTRRIILLFFVPAIIWLTAPSPASGNTAMVFQTGMYGANVVPPVSSGAWGFVRFFFNDSRTEADYTVDVKGLSNTLVEGADLLRGQPGSNGALVRHLADGGFIVTSGHLTLSAAELADIIAGNFYVTLYTKAHPDGELRGQVYVPSGFVPGAAPNGAEPLFNGIPAPVAPPVIVSVPGAAPDLPEVAAETAAPPAPAGRPAGASSPIITPPNTGDAGLVAGNMGPVRAMMVGLAAAVIGVGLMFAAGYSRR